MEVGGPEGRLILGKFAEEEVLAFFENFAGWKLLAKNSDFCKRGLDLLFACNDPYTGKKEGIVADSKHVEHGQDFTSSTLRSKLGDLYSKLDTFATCNNLLEDERVRGRIDRLKIGITALRFAAFDYTKYVSTLADFQPESIRSAKDVPVMIALGNDRLAAFARVQQEARGRTILWKYFRYLENTHERFSPILSPYMLVADFIPGAFVFGSEESRFLLVFGRPSIEFFEFYASFEDRFQFNPHVYLFTDGRADQESVYAQFLPEDQRSRTIQILETEKNLSLNLARVFLPPKSPGIALVL